MDATETLTTGFQRAGSKKGKHTMCDKHPNQSITVRGLVKKVEADMQQKITVMGLSDDLLDKEMRPLFPNECVALDPTLKLAIGAGYLINTFMQSGMRVLDVVIIDSKVYVAATCCGKHLLFADASDPKASLDGLVASGEIMASLVEENQIPNTQPALGVN